MYFCTCETITNIIKKLKFISIIILCVKRIIILSLRGKKLDLNIIKILISVAITFGSFPKGTFGIRIVLSLLVNELHEEGWEEIVKRKSGKESKNYIL